MFTLTFQVAVGKTDNQASLCEKEIDFPFGALLFAS